MKVVGRTAPLNVTLELDKKPLPFIANCCIGDPAITGFGARDEIPGCGIAVELVSVTTVKVCMPTLPTLVAVTVTGHEPDPSNTAQLIGNVEGAAYTPLEIVPKELPPLFPITDQFTAESAENVTVPPKGAVAVLGVTVMPFPTPRLAASIALQATPTRSAGSAPCKSPTISTSVSPAIPFSLLLPARY